jgi:hypothetical protein
MQAQPRKRIHGYGPAKQQLQQRTDTQTYRHTHTDTHTARTKISVMVGNSQGLRPRLHRPSKLTLYSHAHTFLQHQQGYFEVAVEPGRPSGPANALVCRDQGMSKKMVFFTWRIHGQVYAVPCKPTCSTTRGISPKAGQNSFLPSTTARQTTSIVAENIWNYSSAYSFKEVSFLSTQVELRLAWPGSCRQCCNSIFRIGDRRTDDPWRQTGKKPPNNCGGSKK